MKKFVISFAVLFYVCTVKAQPMTLGDCMRYAISNSTKMRIQQAATGDEQIARREAVLKAFTPYINGSIHAYFNFGRAIDPATNTYTNTTSFHNGYNLSTGITLFNGFEAVNNLKISNISLKMGISLEDQAEADICLATMEAFYNVAFYEKMTEIHEQQVETARTSLKLAERQEQLGKKGHADVIQMDAELTQREYDLIRMRNMRNDALMNLKDIIFWPADSTLAINCNIPDEIQPALSDINNTDAVVSYAIANNPAAKIAFGKMENARIQLKTARWQTLPSLGLYAGWSTNYFNYLGKTSTDPFLTQFNANSGEYIQLSITIPIYDKLSRYGNIARKKNAFVKASAEYDQKTREIESEVRRATQDMDGAFAAYIAAQRKADAQKEAYALNVKKLEQGLISPIEYQTATNSYLAATADRLDALFKYYIKKSIVEYYSGINYINQ